MPGLDRGVLGCGGGQAAPDGRGRRGPVEVLVDLCLQVALVRLPAKVGGLAPRVQREAHGHPGLHGRHHRLRGPQQRRSLRRAVIFSTGLDSASGKGASVPQGAWRHGRAPPGAVHRRRGVGCHVT